MKVRDDRLAGKLQVTHLHTRMTWPEIGLEALGWLATAGILGSYFALNLGMMGQWWFNVTGIWTGFGMATSLYSKKAWPAFWLNLAWGVISVIGVIRLLMVS